MTSTPSVTRAAVAEALSTALGGEFTVYTSPAGSSLPDRWAMVGMPANRPSERTVFGGVVEDWPVMVAVARSGGNDQQTWAVMDATYTALRDDLPDELSSGPWMDAALQDGPSPSEFQTPAGMRQGYITTIRISH